MNKGHSNRSARIDTPQIKVEYHPKPNRVELVISTRYSSIAVFEWDLTDFIGQLTEATQKARQLVGNRKLPTKPVRYKY